MPRKDIEKRRALDRIRNKSEKRKQWRKEWASLPENKIKLSEKHKKYRENNKEKLAKKQKEWREKNKEYLKAYEDSRRKSISRKEYRKQLYNSPDMKLKRSIIHSLWRIVKYGGTKNINSVKYLGCSIEDFKKYIESKFQDGMTWENYGLKGWHIDHIRPVSSFDFTDEQQIYECMHYTNLQPLWAEQNWSKNKF